MFRIITPVFSVIGSFRNNSNTDFLLKKHLELVLILKMVVLNNNFGILQ